MSIIILFTKSFSLLEHKRKATKMDYDYVYYGVGLTDYESEDYVEENKEKESKE